MKTINVLGIEYIIRFVSAKEMMETVKEDNPLYSELVERLGPNGEFFAGLCNARDCKIWVNKGMKKEKVEKILIHEIMEAISQEGLLEIEHAQLQAIVNGLFTSGIIKVDHLMEYDEETNKDNNTGGQA
jgi:hypothetical protein